MYPHFSLFPYFELIPLSGGARSPGYKQIASFYSNWSLALSILFIYSFCPACPPSKKERVGPAVGYKAAIWFYYF